MKKIVFVFIALFGSALNLSAHFFFVNTTESNAHGKKSISVNIGWGHALPMDELFMGDSLKSYSVYDPNMKKMELKFDKNANANMEKRIYEEMPSEKFPEALVFSGDSFVNKIYFNDKSADGVYQIAAVSEPIQFSWWEDEKGRNKWGRVYLDEIKNPKKIHMSWNFQSFAKAFASVGKWQKPKPLGHALEFIPISDLTKVKIGDTLEFEVLFLGEPLQDDKSGIPFEIKAFSEQNDAGFVGAAIRNGKVKFRVTSGGKWLLSASIKKSIDEKIAPELKGKALIKGYDATATFFVSEF